MMSYLGRCGGVKGCRKRRCAGTAITAHSAMTSTTQVASQPRQGNIRVDASPARGDSERRSAGMMEFGGFDHAGCFASSAA
jgi:hypothetical protein